MKSKVKLFGGGKVKCRVIKFKQYKWGGGGPESKRFEISYYDPVAKFEKKARYPLHRIEFSEYERDLFKDEILNFYD